MPTLFSRRYMRGKPGRTERIVGAGLLVLLVLIVGMFLLTGGLFADTVNRISVLRAAKDFIGISERPLFQASIEGSEASGESLFGDAGEGLMRPTDIQRYTDNLYEKIDGKEGVFRAYLVVELRFGEYLDPKNQDLYDVYIYDMGEPANAFGIYMTERSGQVQKLDIGRDAYISGASVFYCQGKYYVNVLGPGEGGDDEVAKAKKIAAVIAEKIEDTDEPFWAEAFLPSEDRLPGSFRYSATSALGYEFLERMFLADYQTKGKSYQMYLLKAGNPEEARELFNKFAEATAKYDKVLSRQAGDGGEMLVSESLDIYGATFYKGEYFGGVTECDDRELAEKEASLLRSRLPVDSGK